MASPKNYKNVYTILEKVKKGEIDTYYKDKDGLFGKINFYKKPDLIKPHLHYIDEHRLENIMDVHMRDQKMVQENYNKFCKTTDYKKIDPSKQPNNTTFYQKFQENYSKFPKHMAKDVFKMFYNKIDKLDFEERDEKNYTKFKFLEKANNPVGKIMTEHSNLKSAIFARNVMAYFITRMTMMDFIDPDESQKVKDGLSGKSDFDNDGVDDALQDMMGNKQSQKMLEDAMQQAQDLCKQMDDAMGDDIQEQMFENSNKGGEDSTAGKLSPDYIKMVTAKLESINLSMGAFKEKIKKLLDKSVSYFSAKKETTYEDLFNSDNMAGLEDFELLHPKLRKIFAEDLQVKSTKSIGKIDVYIDISGSMDSDCGVGRAGDGRYVSKIDFCKTLTAKLKSIDMLNDVYVFNTKVKKMKNDIITISMLSTSGGTDIDAAVRTIQKNNVNALVITDAEDHCQTYCDKAFFIGVKGARFNGFHAETIKEYSDKNQVIVFDGITIKKVNEQGYISK